MNQANAIDLSFIPAALNRINQLLHKADVAEARKDHGEALDRLLEAGGEARAALNDLNGAGLWDALRAERQRRQEQWQHVVIPATDKLLEAMGYQPPPPASSFIDPGTTAMRQALGIPESGSPDPIAQAQAALTELDQLLQDLISDLKAELQRSENPEPEKLQKLKGAIGAACKGVSKELGRALVAAIVLPTVQTAIRMAFPDADELLQELIKGAAHMLPSLSTALIVSIAIPDLEVRNLIGSPADPRSGPRVGSPEPPSSRVVQGPGDMAMPVTGPSGQNRSVPPAGPVQSVTQSPRGDGPSSAIPRTAAASDDTSDLQEPTRNPARPPAVPPSPASPPTDPPGS